MTTVSEAAPPLGRLPLKDAKAIRVKYSFTNPKHIPRGLQKRRFENDRTVTEHIAVARVIQPELVMVGRHRPGHMDTGEPIIVDLGPTQARSIRRQLAEVGWFLTDLWWYALRRKRRKTKLIVVCEFTQGVAKKLSPTLLSSLERFEGDNWSCNVWQNPNAVHTVNLAHRDKPGEPEYVLAIVDKAITALPCIS